MKLFGHTIIKSKELRGLRTELRLKEEFIHSCGEKGDKLRMLVKNLSQVLNDKPTTKEGPTS